MRALNPDEVHSGLIPLSALFHAVGETLSARKAKYEKQEELKSELLESLFNVELIATGFREAPSSSSAPVAISADAFDDTNFYVDWDKGLIHVHGKRFGRVRITDPNIPLPTHAALRPGRPGSNAAIVKAIDALIADRSIPPFCDMDRKRACEMIRAHLGKAHFRGNGLSDENLGKYIVRKCGKKHIS
jgi:hypothetical protein